MALRTPARYAAPGLPYNHPLTENAVRITYTSKTYAPDKVTARYVQNRDGAYHFCETNAKRWDIRQGVVEASELPELVRAAADARRSHFPAYVEWPL